MDALQVLGVVALAIAGLAWIVWTALAFALLLKTSRRLRDFTNLLEDMLEPEPAPEPEPEPAPEPVHARRARRGDASNVNGNGRTSSGQRSMSH